MSLEKNKAIVRRYFEAVDKRNLAITDELIAPDYFHRGFQVRSREEWKESVTMVLKAFPDYHEAIEDMMAEGDKVWVRYKGTGTNRGEYLGLAPTGKKVTYEAVCIYRIVNGKIVEMWSVSDMLDFFKQLGVIEYTEKAKKLFPKDVK